MEFTIRKKSWTWENSSSVSKKKKVLVEKISFYYKCVSLVEGSNPQSHQPKGQWTAHDLYAGYIEANDDPDTWLYNTFPNPLKPNAFCSKKFILEVYIWSKDFTTDFL